MSNIAKVDSLWRYPVKSMRGEKLEESIHGILRIYGDRLFAVRSSASPKGFPYLTLGNSTTCCGYRPRFRYPDRAARPINLTRQRASRPA